MFPQGAFFACVLDEMFIEVSQFHDASDAMKNFWLCTCAQALFFSHNALS